MPGSHCFPKEQRLLASAQFDLVFKGGQRVGGKLFLMIKLANALGHPRLGLVVSKKNARRAVARNRIKRLVRESFRHISAELPAVDVLVLPSKHTKDASNEEIFASLDDQWRRLSRSS